MVPLTDDETGINQPLLENIRISVTENGIILNGVPQGTPISIYTLGGNMICQKRQAETPFHSQPLNQWLSPRLATSLLK